MKIVDEWKALTETQKSLPVDVHGLPERLGINFRVANLADGISGMLEKDRDGYLISVNAADPLTRQRFTLAHEIGHYMLHRNLIGDGLDDDRAYRSAQIGKYHNTFIGPAEETEANKFAANLLMPKKMVDAEWAKDKTTLSSMAALFQVSEHAMAIRLGLQY